MGLLPKAIGTRPRIACEMRAEGVVAARAEDAAAALSAVERVSFEGRAAIANNSAIALAGTEKIAAVKRALDAVSERGRDVTLVVPDAAARVLLVDFDELPAKASEALPVVRFRLKKLLPFDADDAAVSYQVMTETRGATQVLAVAMQRETLAEYESMVREAGYEPGTVLPSTLAALAGLDEDAPPTLLVNAGLESVTTAIVKDGALLLHRTIDLATGNLTGGAAAPRATGGGSADGASAPSVSAAAGVTPAVVTSQEASRDTTIAAIAARFAAMEGQPTSAPRAAEGTLGSRVGSALASGLAQSGAEAQSAAMKDVNDTPAVAVAAPLAPGEEIAQAVNVATAYFEDTLGMAPQVILSAGTLGADALARLLGASAPRVQEMVSTGTNGVPAGWLAGVRGALRS